MTTTTASAVSAAARRAIDAAMTEFYAAWSARDTPRCQAQFSPRAELMLWGTDGFEQIIGPAEAARAFPGWIASCPPWISIEPSARVLDLHDDIAWVADEAEGRWAGGGDAGTSRFRITLVWERTGDAWRIVHAHLSSPG